MTTFTADAARALDGPQWLADRRIAAFERFADSPLPSTSEEVWRYSRIGDLDLDRFSPVDGGPPDEGLPDPVAATLGAIGDVAGVVLTRNGRVVSSALEPEAESAGLTLGPLRDHPDGSALLGSVLDHNHDAIGDLHDAFLADPVGIEVPAGAVLDRPVLVAHWVESDGVAAFPHLVVHLGSDSEATVVELFASADVAALTAPVTELRAADGARLRYLNVQTLGPRLWQLGQQSGRLGRDARLTSGAVMLGGDYARLRADWTLDEQGAEADLLAVYFGEGTQMHDVRTLQDHVAPRTRSSLLFKGAVEDHARSVYSGMIRIGAEARGTSAHQTNRNVTLSPTAWAESVPNLEIETNDVQCSHASAVGPVDEDQRFYLESRGVPPDEAERLIMIGFFDEVLARLPATGLRPRLRDAVIDKLARRQVEP